MSDKFNPEDMPILSLTTTGTTRYEASRFLDSPEAIAAYDPDDHDVPFHRPIILKAATEPAG